MSQARDLLEASRLPNRLSPSEYYDHALASRTSGREAFLGWRSPAIGQLQPVSWHALANDKLIYYDYIASLGFLVPELHAVLHEGGRLTRARTFTTRAELARYLRTECPFPFYGKPAHGLYGMGNVLCERYDANSDELILAGTSTISVDAFVASLQDRSGLGYLLQEVLRPPSCIVDLWGPRFSTVRVVVVLTEQGPRTFMTEVKIPVGSNVVDNYADGKTGNMLALTDNDTGEIIRLMVPGIGYTERTDIRHPDTGTPLMGTVVPRWQEVIALAHRASRAFPALRLQGWDIAHSTKGMMALELNLVTGRTAYNHQRFCARGLLTDELRVALYGDKT